MIDSGCFQISPDKLRREILSILHEDTFVEELLSIFSEDPKSLVVYFLIVNQLAHVIKRKNCTENLKGIFLNDPFIESYIKNHLGCEKKPFNEYIKNIFSSEKTLELFDGKFSRLKFSKETSLFIALCLTGVVQHDFASAVAVKKIEKLMEEKGVSRKIDEILRRFYSRENKYSFFNDQKV